MGEPKDTTDTSDQRNVVELHKTTKGAENYIVEERIVVLMSKTTSVVDLLGMAQKEMKDGN